MLVKQIRDAIRGKMNTTFQTALITQLEQIIEVFEWINVCMEHEEDSHRE